MTLRTYITRRLIIIFPTFLLTTLILFTLIHLAPGDPITIMLRTSKAKITPEMMAAMRTELGLDQPIPVQYFMWLSRLLRGDLGYSYITREPATKMIGIRLGRTLELMLITEILSLTLAIVLGAICAVKQHSLIDAVSSLVALIGYSISSFWVALMLILVFSLQLRWLPSFGVQTVGATLPSFFHAFIDHLRHLVLPVTVLIIGGVAYNFRLVRSSMLEVLRQDYIITARAKGLRERVVIYKHALRNALLPVVTSVGYSIGFLFGGAVIIETIFSWPGLGKWGLDLAMARDYPPLMGWSVIIALMVLLCNLSADITYAIVNPRIRYD